MSCNIESLSAWWLLEARGAGASADGVLRGVDMDLLLGIQPLKRRATAA
jgi:hypothetical protein